MNPLRLLRSTMIRHLADVNTMETRHGRAQCKRHAAGEPQRVWYYHQVDDPYSHLAAQALSGLLARFEIELLPRVTDQPQAIAIHDDHMWDQWSRRECAAMAPYYGLDTTDSGQRPQAELVQLARRILVKQETNPTRFAAVAVNVGTALQAGDASRLEALAAEHGTADAAITDKHCAENRRARYQQGHYLGAMFFDGVEWYWGIDRLHYLEKRLTEQGLRRSNAPPGSSVSRTQKAPDHLQAADRVTLEFFPSLRSPYTHLSYDRVRDLCQRYPVDLVIRPVLPMMMRGVKADMRKGRYIMWDTKRESLRLGVQFGNVWDPFGAPIKRAYSLFPWAMAEGRGFEYLQSYSRAVWSERVNAWNEEGLRMIVERAGLDWSKARPHLDSKDWEAVMEDNVQVMLKAGSWGVPTFRLPPREGQPEFTVWGQDRIWLIQEEIARRLRAS